MIKTIHVTDSYLYLPAYPGLHLQTVSIFLEGEEGNEEEKIMEFRIPIPDPEAGRERDGQEPAFLARIPVKEHAGRMFRIEGAFSEAAGAFMECGPLREVPSGPRPRIHFTAQTGWTNDPNGLVYQDGLYHLYFQYNPLDIHWENMSWGHAVSADLLHWEQHDSVLFPDAEGTMFSGCGLVNERGLLGLADDALLFFYTVAGHSSDWSQDKGFVQKAAYSLDGGESLVKIGKPCIGEMYFDSRDPKVLWHEESQAYVMPLWLKGNDFGIFRSEDLENWEMTQEIHLEDGWECPDLLRLTSAEGEEKWFFWSADGYYFPGEFDGFLFRPDGPRHTAYLTKVPYAAQTYAGVKDRVISVPWLRLENDGRLFTGAYGIPTELSWERRGEDCMLIQRPVRELTEQMVPVPEEWISSSAETVSCRLPVDEEGRACAALAVRIRRLDENGGKLCWESSGMPFVYDPASGILFAGDGKCQAGPGIHDFLLLMDDRILEAFLDDGRRMGTFDLKEKSPAFSLEKKGAQLVEFFMIK